VEPNKTHHKDSVLCCRALGAIRKAGRLDMDILKSVANNKYEWRQMRGALTGLQKDHLKTWMNGGMRGSFMKRLYASILGVESMRRKRAMEPIDSYKQWWLDVLHDEI